MPQSEISLTYKLLYLENLKLNFKRQVVLIYPLIISLIITVNVLIYILICIQQPFIEKFTICMLSVVGWDFFKQRDILKFF